MRARSADKRAGEGEAGEHLPANRLRLTEAVWVKSDQLARAPAPVAGGISQTVDGFEQRGRNIRCNPKMHKNGLFVVN